MLSEDQRRKFAAYCLIEQMNKIGGGMTKAITDRYEAMAQAYEFVGRDLEMIEDQRIG